MLVCKLQKIITIYGGHLRCFLYKLQIMVDI